MLTYCFTHLICIYCILFYCILANAQSNIYIFLNYVLLLLDLCVLLSIVRYYCTVGARNTSISLHLQ
jgi:hypothetical protein